VPAPAAGRRPAVNPDGSSIRAGTVSTARFSTACHARQYGVNTL
jgi:hypothetical protein